MLKNYVITMCVVLFLYCQVNAEERKLEQLGKYTWSYENVKPMTPTRSFGANAGVIVGTKGVMVIDTLVSAKEGDVLLADIREITSKPILYVVNTHYHADHSGGNCVFAAERATIIAAKPGAELVRTNNADGLKHPEKFGLTKEDIEGTVLAPADIDFTGEMDIDLGGVVVTLKSLNHGHCQDNLVAWVKADKILFAGDLMFVACHPFMGESNISDWLENLDELSKVKAAKIIPGHGPIASQKDIEDLKVYIKSFDANAKALCKGKQQKDAPQLVKELLRKLPPQGRLDLINLIEFNLRMKYLPPSKR